MKPPVAYRNACSRLQTGAVVALLWMQICPQEASAEDFSDALGDLSLEQLLDIDVVYGASKFEQRTIEAPASITIIRSEDIERHGYSTLGEVLDHVRGFYTSYDRNYTYAGTRGFGRPGDFNSRLLVLLDGHRLNNATYGQAPVGTDFPLDLENVERIEVLRGPGSVLYGTNAMFAVVNVITRVPEGVAPLDASVTAGELGTRRARAATAGQSGAGLAWAVSGSLFERRGGDLYFEEFNKTETNDGVADGMDGDQTGHLQGRARWRRLSVDLLYGTREKVVPTAAYGTSFNDDGNRTTDTYFLTCLGLENTLTPAWTLTTKLTHNHHYYEGAYVYEDEEPGSRFIVGETTLSDRLVGEVQILGRPHSRHTSTWGLETTLDWRVNQHVWDPEGVALDDDQRTVQWGLYGQHEIQASSWLLLNGGLRLDRDPSVGAALSPRTAVIVTPASGTALKLLYGQAFRAPSFYERYYHDGGITAKPPARLDSERIHTTSVALEQYVGSSTFCTVEAFTYRITDLVSLVTDPSDDLLVYENLEEAECSGVECEVRRDWTAGVTGRVSYGYQEARDRKTDTMLTNAPRHVAKASVSAPLFRSATVAMDLTHVGERRTIGQGKVTDHTVTDINVTIPLAGSHLQLGLGVTNLFDVEYADPASEEHIQSTILQDGRVARLRLRCTL